MSPRALHADARRAPAATASSTSIRITRLSSGPCRRPRPPRSPGLFFEHEQRRRLGERLLLPLQLAPELADLAALLLYLGERFAATQARERLLAPLLEHRRVNALGAQEHPKLTLREAAGLQHDRELLLGRPLLRLLRVWFLVGRHALGKPRRFLQPTRQRRLRQACLGGQRARTHGVRPGEFLDHAGTKPFAVRNHASSCPSCVVSRRSIPTSREATTTLAHRESDGMLDTHKPSPACACRTSSS